MRTRLLSCRLLGVCLSGTAAADVYRVKTTEGPGFASPEEVAAVLEKSILPLFDSLIALETEEKIVAGGLPAASRTFYLIVEADSHDEVDRKLRDLPAWGVFSWRVTPLQSIKGRADMERQNLKMLKSGN